MEEDEGQSGRGRALATLFITIAQTLSLTFFKQAYILNYFAMIFLPAVFVFRQVRRSGSLEQKTLDTETQRHSPLTVRLRAVSLC